MENVNWQNAEAVWHAAQHADAFDYEKALDCFIKQQEKEYIYKAGDQWKTFDYINGWLALETSMKKGARWRGKAFENRRWKKALQKMWQTACSS